MKSNIGTGRAKKAMMEGFLILTIVRGLRSANIIPKVSVCAVEVGR